MVMVIVKIDGDDDDDDDRTFLTPAIIVYSVDTNLVVAMVVVAVS